MPKDTKQYESYAEVKARLDEIVEAVKNDDLPLDDALDLYEEAVTLGLRVSDMLEDDIDEAEGIDDDGESVEASAVEEGAGASEADEADEAVAASGISDAPAASAGEGAGESPSEPSENAGENA